MIICHFFTRKIGESTYVMVDTSADSCSKPLFASPEVLFEASGDPKGWVARARQAILGRFPDLVSGRECMPDDRRKTKTQCFDIPFYDEGDDSRE